MGTELGHREECEAGTGGGEHLPVVESGQLAVLDQVVPEAGEAVPGEHLERGGGSRRWRWWKRYGDANKNVEEQWVKREVVGSHQARVEPDPLGVEPGLGPQDYVGLHNAVNI